jgi:hypothetical protein
MPVDLRGALLGALDVATPPFAYERVRARAHEHLGASERRRVRSVLPVAAFVAVLAIFAGANAPRVTYPAAVAALPVPAPAPQAT